MPGYSQRFRIFRQSVVRNWKYSLSIALLSVAAYDTWIDELTVIAATFIGLAALPWLIDMFDRITLPGGIEIDLAKARKVLDEREVVATQENLKEFQYIPDDPNLALVALRIEIEKRLRALAEENSNGKPTASQNLYSLIDNLVSSGRIDREVADLIKGMLPAMNRAAHGETVPDDAKSWVQKQGPRILEALTSFAKSMI